MSYRVDAVTDRRTRRDFERVPWTVYRDDPRWVPPLWAEERRTLDAARNPYFAGAALRRLVCYRRTQPVARLSVVCDPRHRDAAGRPLALFGFFESLPDDEAVGRLVEVAMAYCRALGAATIEGPFSPTHYSPVGLQANRFAVGPAFFEPYNPPYYLPLLERAGFAVVKRLHTRRNDRVGDYVRRHYGHAPVRGVDGFTVRSAAPRAWRADLERIRTVFNDAFSDNWRFLPVSAAEYAFAARGLSSVTRPDLVTIVEHHGEPVGALLCVLDVNPLLRALRGRVGPLGALRFVRGRRRIDDLLVYAVGIRPAYQGGRAFHLILRALCATALRFKTLTTTWMSDDNRPALRASARLGLTPYKEFVVVARPVAEDAHA